MRINILQAGYQYWIKQCICPILQGGNMVYLGQGPTAAFGNKTNFVRAPYLENGMQLVEISPGVLVSFYISTVL